FSQQWYFSYISSLSLHDALPIFLILGPECVPKNKKPLCSNPNVSEPKTVLKELPPLSDQFESGGNSFRTVFGSETFGFEHKGFRSEENTSELQSRENTVCRLLLE